MKDREGERPKHSDSSRFVSCRILRICNPIFLQILQVRHWAQSLWKEQVETKVKYWYTGSKKELQIEGRGKEERDRQGPSVMQNLESKEKPVMRSVAKTRDTVRDGSTGVEPVGSILKSLCISASSQEFRVETSSSSHSWNKMQLGHGSEFRWWEWRGTGGCCSTRTEAALWTTPLSQLLYHKSLPLFNPTSIRLNNSARALLSLLVCG